MNVALRTLQDRLATTRQPLSPAMRANVPQVAALVSPRGSLLGEPVLRDNVDERYRVTSAVLPSTVRVRALHDRVLALR